MSIESNTGSARDWLGSRNGALQLRRRILFVRGGSAGIAQEAECDGEHASVLVTADGWFASLVMVHQGLLAFRDRLTTRPAPARFLLFLPPGAIVRMPLKAARFETVGVTGEALPRDWPDRALAVPVDLDRGDAQREEALAATLRAVARDPKLPAYVIDADQGVAPHLRRLRRRLFELRGESEPVRRSALEAGLHPASLSRAFSESYGLSPRAYCQRVRIHAAVNALVSGVSIAEASFAAGWNDLSRFYRQFRYATRETPGRYRSAAQSVK